MKKLIFIKAGLLEFRKKEKNKKRDSGEQISMKALALSQNILKIADVYLLANILDAVHSLAEFALLSCLLQLLCVCVCKVVII